MKRLALSSLGFSLIALCLAAIPVGASVYTGGGADPNDWFDADNWGPSGAFGGNGDVPMLLLTGGAHDPRPAFGATFGNNNFTFNQTGASADFLVIGSTAGQFTFNMAGGDLTFGGDGLLGVGNFDGVAMGPATINHTGGTLKQVGGGAGFLIGHSAGATYNLSGGSVIVEIPAVGRTFDIDSPFGGAGKPSSLNITGNGLVDIKAGVNFRIGPGGVLDILDDGMLIWRNRTLTDVATLGGTIRAKAEQVGPDVVFTTDRSPDVLLVMDVNRDTGVIGVSNFTGSPVDIASYSIVSKAGSLNSNNWKSIAGSGDSNSGGSIDPNDVWHKFSAAGSTGDLSEGTIGMATIANGQTLTIDDGVNGAWSKYFEDAADLSLQYLTGAGIVTAGLVTFSGGPRYAFGDLNFDRQPLNAADWDVFVNSYGSNLTGLSPAERYRRGDLNRDGVHSVADFNQFKQVFDAANGAGAFAAMIAGQVPEPSSAVLVGLAVFAGVLLSRKRVTTRLLSLLLVALLISSSLTPMSLASTWTNALANGDWNNADNWGGGDITGGPDGAVPTQAGGIGAAVGATPLTINQAGLTSLYMVVNNAVNITGGDLTYTGDGLWGTTIGGASGGVGMATITQTGGTITQTSGGGGFLVGHNQPGSYTISGGSVVVQSASASLSVDWTLDGTPSTVSSLNISGTGVVDVEAGSRIHFGPQAMLNVTGDGRLIWRGHTVADVFSKLSGGNFQDAKVISDTAVINAVATQVGPDVHFIPGVTPIVPLKLVVNTNTGALTLSGATIPDDVNFYEITSEMNSLNHTAWTSGNFDAQNLDAVGDASNQSWSTLHATPGNLTEAFLSGFSRFDSTRSESLGMGYDSGVDARDLVMLIGTTNGRSLTIPVEYVGAQVMAGDYNSNGTVDAADYVVWRDKLGTSATLPGENPGASTPGLVDQEDYDFWRSRFGATTGSGSAQASVAPVPEPASLSLLLVLIVTLAFACRPRNRHVVGQSSLIAGTVCIAFAAFGPLARAGTLERDYRLGDDPLENAANAPPPGVLGTGPSNPSPGSTLDSFGPLPGTFIDISVVGTPTYVSVNDRPGAAANNRGAAFDGVDDALLTPISMNSPSGMSSNMSFFPTGYLRNYSGIFAHGMQLWAKPTPGSLNGQRKDLIIDTPQHGIIITANNTWGLQFAGSVVDSQLPVDTASNNGWTHVMQLAGFSDPVRGRSSNGGTLLVNGVAVAASSSTYSAASSALSIGSNQANDGNFYSGILDDVKLFLWGDNSGSGPLTQNWGALDLSVDNDWIRQELARLATLVGKPSIPAGDINFDGIVSGNGLGPAESDDVTAFIDNWFKRNLVNGVQVGDWNSRQNGDLNYDGIVDQYDWQILRAGHPGGAGLSLGAILAHAQVPEPSAAILVLVATGTLAACSRKRRNA